MKQQEKIPMAIKFFECSIALFLSTVYFCETIIFLRNGMVEKKTVK